MIFFIIINIICILQELTLLVKGKKDYKDHESQKLWDIKALLGMEGMERLTGKINLLLILSQWRYIEYQ
jgi:hypothetical protein